MIDRIIDSIDKFKNKRVLIIGDIMLDVYFFGQTNRISPEAPVPIINVQHKKSVLGGAGNVAANIKALGAEPVLIGIIGDDANGNRLKRIMEKTGISTKNLIQNIYENRPTITKTRVLAKDQQLLRLDEEWNTPISGNSLINKIIENIKNEMNNVDIIIISDYAKGMIGPFIPNVFYGSDKIIILDPKPQNIKYYENLATIITPNHEEVLRMVNNGSSNISLASQSLIQQLKCKGVLVTRGKMGISYIESNQKPIHLSTIAKSVVDTTGAGDTTLAAFSLGIASPLSIEESAKIANIAAGKVVSEIGTSTINNEELKNLVKEFYEITVNHFN